MGKIDYRKIYETNKDEWKALTRGPQKYEAFLAGHYSDSNHFVYELLQNAEDARATRVVIEYHGDNFAKKKNDGSLVSAQGNEVPTKLEGLKGEILLFLTHIKLLYWVDKKTGKFSKIMLSEAENGDRLIACIIEGSAYAGKRCIRYF